MSISISIPSTNLTKIDFENLQEIAYTQNINHLYFDSSSHSIKHCTFFDKIRSFFPSLSYTKEKSIALNDGISALISKINTINFQTERTDLDRKVIELFFKNISKLTNNPFYLNSTTNTPKTLLSKSLQNLLSPELLNLRQMRMIEKQTSTNKNRDEALRLKKRVVKAKLAFKLGVKMKSNTGSTGSYRLFSVNGKPLGVFKSSLDCVNWFVRLKQFIKRWSYGQRIHLSSHSAAQPMTEVAAMRLDRKCNFYLTPYSDIIEINGIKGAFLEFLDTYKEAKEILSDFEKKPSYTHEEIVLFQKMAVYDYLIGNLDRHEENWFVRFADNTTNIVDLKCIDNGNSFIKSNPSIKYLMKNQYKWKKEKIAQIPFTDEIKLLVKQNVSQKQIEEFISEMTKDPNLRDLFEPKIIQNLRSRLLVLQNIPDSNLIDSPAQLGEVTSDADINAYSISA